MEPKQPIFQSIFAPHWGKLPVVLQEHYANRPYCSDRVTVEGLMKVEISPLAKLFSPLMRITGALAPYAGDDVPVIVHFESEPGSNAVCFNRIFHFPKRKPYHFHSRLMPVGGNEVIEWMPSGIGWHASYVFDGDKVLMRHLGYKIKLLGKIFSLPLEIFLGKGYAEEEAISEKNFRMHMDIRHRLFGKVYAYSGEFKISEVKLDE
jgi:hypothetical protein